MNMEIEIKKKIIVMLKDISMDLQAKCEDNQILGAEIKEYFDTKIRAIKDGLHIFEK